MVCVGMKDGEPRNEHISLCMTWRSLSLFSHFQTAYARYSSAAFSYVFYIIVLICADDCYYASELMFVFQIC